MNDECSNIALFLITLGVHLAYMLRIDTKLTKMFSGILDFWITLLLFNWANITSFVSYLRKWS